MIQRELAERLLLNSGENRTALINENISLCNRDLAKRFQQICYEIWTEKPQEVSKVVETLSEILQITKDLEIEPYLQWIVGFRYLINGEFQKSIDWINESENSFLALDHRHEAATTQTTKVNALAMLGRYDEAVNCGLSARDVLLEFSDIYSAGKIEHNIGNLYWRRDFYLESEPFLESAHERFLQLGDNRQLAMVENCQAFVKGLQNNFREAEVIYQRARKRCIENNFTITEAEIEIGMSNLYLFQSRFDLALKYLESSRSKYESLGMIHQSANCELEIADIYLELNLLPEARDFYKQATETFLKTGMQAELGRCYLNKARILFLSEDIAGSREFLEKAEKLFIAEGNEISTAAVKFAKAQISFRETRNSDAKYLALEAAEIFKKGENLRLELLANWLVGEIHSSENDVKNAIEIQTKVRDRAKGYFPQIEYLSLVSLGKLSGNETYFEDAIALIENSRLTISSEELRTAFATDKLLPYNELVKINLGRKDYVNALKWCERSRSKTLLESMEFQPNFEESNEDLVTLKQELNWLYSRLNRQSAAGLSERKDAENIRGSIAKAEKEYSEKLRRFQINNEQNFSENTSFDLQELQGKLQETTVIEYLFRDRKLSAFLVTEDSLEFIEDIAGEDELNAEIEKYLFQVKTGRFISRLSAENQSIALQRILNHSKHLFDLLIRPLAKKFQTKRLTIIPCKALHYLPFQALHDGEKFLIESFEISYSPSASVLQQCLNRGVDGRESALLVGVSDKITPMVETEIKVIGGLFEKSVDLLNQNATLANLRENLPDASILHLACHGKFRSENPSFSSLSLFSENLTVADAQNLNLRDRLVVLSACETGLSKIVSGEELIGLARGFLKAGASSLVLSLWTVNDESTLDLMRTFYSHILSGNSPSKALQVAQIQMLEQNSHPYFWSPFVIIGRW